MVWNLLQVSDVLDVEFASALAETVVLNAWEPERKLFARYGPGKQPRERLIQEPPLTIKGFALQRGYSRFPFAWLRGPSKAVLAQLLEETPFPETAPLICTVPYFAAVAERWPGPVVYWLTDRIEHYRGVDAKAIHRLDRRMCEVATLVCPNSQRLAEYLQDSASCPPGKIAVLPNATRESNISAQPLRRPAPLPKDLADVPRPLAGVIGNLAGNLDWLFLDRLVELTPELHWAFIGPASMSIAQPDQRAARRRVMCHRRAHFLGKKPYGHLAAYARALDVAVLPYRLCEPTYSGSSTRFYEHLAACRPMLATRGFEELLHKEPLLKLVDTADEAAVYLQDLQQGGFNDHLQERRWRESRTGTWQQRAACMRRELERRWHGGHGVRDPNLPDVTACSPDDPLSLESHATAADAR